MGKRSTLTMSVATNSFSRVVMGGRHLAFYLEPVRGTCSAVVIRTSSSKLLFSGIVRYKRISTSFRECARKRFLVGDPLRIYDSLIF